MKKKGLFRKIFGVDRYLEPVREVKDSGRLVGKGIFSRLMYIFSKERFKEAYSCARKPSAPALPGYVVLSALITGMLFVIAGILVMCFNDFKTFYLVMGCVYASFGLMPILAVIRRRYQYKRFHREALEYWKKGLYR